MRSFSLFRLLLSAFFFLGASSAFAQWSNGGWLNASSGTHFYPSAIAACQARVPSSGGYSNPHLRNHSASPEIYECWADYVSPNYPDNPPSTINFGNVWLSSGATCTPPNQVQSDGSCANPNPCQEKAGQTTNFFTNIPPDKLTPGGEFLCINSCRATWSGECASHNTDPNLRACWGLATFNGQACSSGDWSAGPVGPPADDPGAPDCGPDHVWSGTTCVPKPPKDCEGDDCPPDDGEGGEPCEGDDCPPDDGEGGEPCEGDDCPPDDGDGDGDGDCEGDDCPGDGDGDGEGGDGESETGKDKDGKPCNPLTDADCVPCNPATDPTCASLVKNLDDCEVEVVCQGDAIQCAILKEQRRSRCAWKWTPELTKAITDELTGPQFELQEKTVPVANMFNEAMSKSRWLPTSCPSPKTVSVLGRSYQLSYQPVCEFASALSPLIVAFASIFFSIFVGRGIKGN